MEIVTTYRMQQDVSEWLVDEFIIISKFCHDNLINRSCGNCCSHVLDNNSSSSQHGLCVPGGGVYVNLGLVMSLTMRNVL